MVAPERQMGGYCYFLSQDNAIHVWEAVVFGLKIV